MPHRIGAALAFYAWLFERRFSAQDRRDFENLARQAGKDRDQLSLNIIRHAAKRWDEVRASHGTIQRNAYLPEAVTLLRDLKSALSEWLVARYDQAHPAIVVGEVPLTNEIVDALFELRQLRFGESDEHLRSEFIQDAARKWRHMAFGEKWAAARAPQIWTTFRVVSPMLTADGVAIDIDGLIPSFDSQGFISTPFALAVGPYLSEEVERRFEPQLEWLTADPNASDPLLVRFPGQSPAWLRFLRRIGGTKFGGDDWETTGSIPPDDQPQEHPDLDDEGGLAAEIPEKPDKGLMAAEALTDDERQAGGADPLRGDGPQPPARLVAYPLIDCDAAVVAGEVFTLTVGLSPVENPIVAGGPLHLPAQPAFDILLTVDADGFDREDGSEDWQFPVSISEDNHYPSVAVQVKARGLSEDEQVRPITTTYMLGSQCLGNGVRNVTVVRTKALLAGVNVSPEKPPAMVSPASDLSPDLTVHILTRRTDAGMLKWMFNTRDNKKWQQVSWPIGTDEDDAKDFVQKVVAAIEKFSNDDTVGLTLSGIGGYIRRAVPPIFWTILSSVSEGLNRAPTVLIITDEYSIPWELSTLPQADGDDSPERHLGVVAAIGRWATSAPPDAADADGLHVSRVAVVSGKYPGTAKLPGAEAEAARILAEYKAVDVPATREKVIEHLRTETNDLLHFAVHGRVQDTKAADGLVMTDRKGDEYNVILDWEISACKKIRGAMVFINACQVGQTTTHLGSLGGIVGAFLNDNARGVIAPLWSIKDDESATISESFYTSVFAGSKPVAEALREERAKFPDTYKTPTCLAYQYWGHPCFTMTFKKEGNT